VRGENMSGEHRLKLFRRSLNCRLLKVDADIIHENRDRGTGQPLCIADEDGSLLRVRNISGKIYRVATNRSYGSGELGCSAALNSSATLSLRSGQQRTNVSRYNLR
jgi:hypothetical protein